MLQLFKKLLVVSCVEMARACPKAPNPISFNTSSGTVLCVITELLLHGLILEKEKDQMLHLGCEAGTDCFRSLFQTMEMGEAESQKSNRVAKGKEKRKLQWGELGDRSSCWLADGEHLQHRGLGKEGTSSCIQQVYRKSCMH